MNRSIVDRASAPMWAPSPFINSFIYNSSCFHIGLRWNVPIPGTCGTTSMDKQGLLAELRRGLHPVCVGDQHFHAIENLPSEDLEALLLPSGILQSETMTPPELRQYAKEELRRRIDAPNERIAADAAEAANQAFHLVNGEQVQFLVKLPSEVRFLAKRRLQLLQSCYSRKRSDDP